LRVNSGEGPPQKKEAEREKYHRQALHRASVTPSIDPWEKNKFFLSWGEEKTIAPTSKKDP